MHSYNVIVSPGVYGQCCVVDNLDVCLLTKLCSGPKLKNVLNTEHKKEVLNLRDTGVSQRTTAEQWGVATSAV